MLRRDTMPRSHDPALEQAESGLHGVGVNVAANIDFLFVGNSLVLAGAGTPARVIAKE